MLVAPGMEVIEAAGGMHPFMDWSRSMLTDSGGFQVFSLSKNKALCVIDEEGAHFKHPELGHTIHMTPEVSLETQKIIGADIIMAFDECTPDDASEGRVKEAMARTHRWLRQSKAYHLQHPNSRYGAPQALFGIIQGGLYPSLREESAAFILSMDCDGIAIGGETIGFDMPKTRELMALLRPMLPESKPRYTMGVGLNPQDLCDMVAEGVDMFDCVAPTRNARHGALYSGEFVEKNGWLSFQSEHKGSRLQIKQQRYLEDEKPIMAGCDCATCKHYSRAQLHYLYKQKSVLFASLATQHNVAVMLETCRQMRLLIKKRSKE
jgi:queuine tRNA-ribosyltransferase